jgi:hypothetical protein
VLSESDAIKNDTCLRHSAHDSPLFLAAAAAASSLLELGAVEWYVPDDVGELTIEVGAP